MKKITIFLPLIGFLLGGCSSVNNQVQQLQAQGFSGLQITLVSFLGLLLLLLVIVLVYYAEKRWRILQMIRPSRWLSKLPKFREAKGLQRKIHGGMKGVERVKQNVPGLQSVQLPSLGSRSTGSGKAARPESRGKLAPKQATNWQKSLPRPLQNALKKFNKNKPTMPEAAEQVAETPKDDAVEEPNIAPVSQAVAVEQGAETAVIIPETTVAAQSITPRIAYESVPTAQQIAPEQFEKMSGRELVGRQLDRYRIDAVLDENVQSVVFHGTDLNLGRPVAIRQIRKPAGENGLGPQRLGDSLQTMARFSHPAIARLQDCIDNEDTMLLVHEYVSGPPIDRYLTHMKTKSWQVSLSRTLALMAQVAEGLTAAHQQGIFHGSLHPGRILVVPQTVSKLNGEVERAFQAKLVGFELNHIAGDVTQRPATHLPYLAPEQLQGQSVDARSDIFALGAILYALVTDEAPYQADTFAAAQMQHSTAPQLPTQLRPGLPHQVESIILRAMAVAPDERYQTGSDMAIELRQMAQQLLPTQGEEIEARLTKSAGKLYVYILCSGESPRVIELDKQTLHIGATGDSEIYLPSKSVDVHHAKIERSLLGWSIADLGSENGTFVDGARLLPQVAEEWTPGQSLTVGPYSLLRLDDEAMANGRFQINGEEITLANGADAAAQEPSATLNLNPVYTEVRPGEQAAVQLSLRNNSVQVDHFHVTVQGVPAAWLAISDNDVQLMPGDERVLLLTITPPADHTAVAGRYGFTVTCASASAPEQPVQTGGELMVQSFERLVSSMDPVKHRNKGVSLLTLSNWGNVETTVSVATDDPEEMVTFTQLPPTVMLPPGQTVELDVPVKGKRPFMGHSRMAPFVVQVKTASGEETPQNGQLELRPYLPTWVASVASVLMVLLCLGGMFFINYRQNQEQLAQTSAMATQAAIPAPTATVEWPTPVPTVAPMPNNCAAIKAQTADAVDGEFTIYLGQDEASPISVYCANMDSAPAEYLTLVSNDMSNYASVNFPNHELFTQFERVRINVNTLTIDPTDRTFAITTGTVPENGEQQVNDYGRALGCNEGQIGAGVGRANIDLSGTGFALADSVEFVVEGQDVEDADSEILANGTIVNLSVSGRCGWIWPRSGLQLVYTGVTEVTEVALESN